MDLRIAFTGERIVPPAAEAGPGVGAVLEFEGVVRGEEKGNPISALRYELYEPMARRVMTEILRSLGETHPCLAVTVVHRFGLVPVGEAAIYLRVESPHRGSGLRLLEAFMNQLKTDVPIWKVEAVSC